MRIINRADGQVKIMTSRQQILLNLLAPIKEQFSLVSNTLTDLIRQYKDVPLTPYKPTKKQLQRMAIDKDYAMDIPKYEIKGYDDAVSGSRFDNKLCDEFFERFMNKDINLIKWINETHPQFRIEL